MNRTGTSVRIAGRTIEVNRPSKLLFDAAEITKSELVDYYATAAPVMLPHLSGYPLALRRFPNGIEHTGFFQKQRPDHAPSWISGETLDRVTGGSITMVVARESPPLVWLAEQGTITFHPWLSRADHPNHPDRLIVDLDPPSEELAPVLQAARAVHALLDELQLPGYPMTTGSRGLHVVVPIRREGDFDQVRAFARELAEVLAQRRPDLLTTQIRKDQRHGRLFVDVLRNAYGQHAVAPYSVRALPRAPVATPLWWEEVDNLPSAQHWTLRTVGPRMKQDPWHGMTRRAHSLPRAHERLRQLHGQCRE